MGSRNEHRFYLKIEEFLLFNNKGKQDLIRLHGNFLCSLNKDHPITLELYQLYDFFVELKKQNGKTLLITAFHWENRNQSFEDELKIVDLF